MGSCKGGTQTMVTNTKLAVRWALWWLARRPDSQPVAHSDLEHAHWDRSERRWLTHEHPEAPALADAA